MNKGGLLVNSGLYILRPRIKNSIKAGGSVSVSYFTDGRIENSITRQKFALRSVEINYEGLDKHRSLQKENKRGLLVSSGRYIYSPRIKNFITTQKIVQ